MAVHRLRAVVSDADGDALRVDELADVVRVHAFDFERDGTDALLVGAGSEDSDAVDIAHFEQFVGDGAFVRLELFHADVHQPFGGDTGGDDLCHRLRARFESCGRLHVLGFLVHPASSTMDPPKLAGGNASSISRLP